MTTDVEGRESPTTTVERAAHAFCPLCTPDPQPGERVTALCGVTYPFWGRRNRPMHVCQVCAELASEVVYQCGHSAQAM